MTKNVIVTLKQISGSASNKSQSTLATGVYALILPVGNEMLVMYPDIPLGGGFSFVIYSDSISKIPPETEITITNAMSSQFTTTDKFIVKEVSRKDKIAGQIVHTGICVKVG